MDYKTDMMMMMMMMMIMMMMITMMMMTMMMMMITMMINDTSLGYRRYLQVKDMTRSVMRPISELALLSDLPPGTNKDNH